jgi:hypothetical protein
MAIETDIIDDSINSTFAWKCQSAVSLRYYYTDRKGRSKSIGTMFYSGRIPTINRNLLYIRVFFIKLFVENKNA